jgi:hypothetical protein
MAQESGHPALSFFRIWPEASWLGKVGKGSYVVEAKPAAVLDFVNSFQVGGGSSIPHTVATQAVKRIPAVAARVALRSLLKYLLLIP